MISRNILLGALTVLLTAARPAFPEQATSRTDLGSGQLFLAQKGIAKAYILLPPDATPVETFAASAMAGCLKRITDATFKIVSENGTSLTNEIHNVISIGRTILAKDVRIQGPPWKRENPEAFRIVRRGYTLIICGNWQGGSSDQGTLWGVYSFLEKLGIGSYLSDPLGDIFPNKPTLEIGDVDESDAPAFEMRGGADRVADHLRRVQASDDKNQEIPKDLLWFKRSAAPRRIEFYHMYQYVVTPQVRRDHPEWFADTQNSLNGGKRLPPTNTGQRGEDVGICLSHPGIRNLFIEYFRRRFREHPNLFAASICPDDYPLGDRCNCTNCLRLMELSGAPSIVVDSTRSASDLHIDFVNAVAKALEEEFPDQKLITYAYLDYLDPPKRTRVHPNVIVMIAPLRCPDELHPALEKIVHGWRQMGARKLYWYGYVLSRPPIPHLIAERFRNYQRLGVDGVYLEFTPGIDAFSSLNRWIYSKLCWNPCADVNDLLDEYCRNLFGNDVGSLMRRFFVAWELKPPFADEDIPRLLAAAEKLAGGREFEPSRRVRLFKMGYELYRSSVDLDRALKANDILMARDVVRFGIETANSLKGEYPGWGLESNVALLNRTAPAEYSVAVLPALENLLNSEIPPFVPEPPTPGRLVCLTPNAGISSVDRIETNVSVKYAPGITNDRECAKLFDGEVEGEEHSFFNYPYPCSVIDFDFLKKYQIERVEVCTGMTPRPGHLMQIEIVPIYIEIQTSVDGQSFKPVDRILPRTLRGFQRSHTLTLTARYLRIVTASLNMAHDIDEIRVWGRELTDGSSVR